MAIQSPVHRSGPSLPVDDFAAAARRFVPVLSVLFALRDGRAEEAAAAEGARHDRMAPGSLPAFLQGRVRPGRMNKFQVFCRTTYLEMIEVH